MLISLKSAVGIWLTEHYSTCPVHQWVSQRRNPPEGDLLAHSMLEKFRQVCRDSYPNSHMVFISDHNQAKHVFLGKKPYWYDMVVAKKRLEQEGRNGIHVIYVSVSPFHIGGATLRPSHRTFHLSQTPGGRLQVDLLPVTFPEVLEFEIPPEDFRVQPEICKYCNYNSLCSTRLAEGLSFSDLAERSA